ncbi:MAG: CDP-glucose 4,6-dehydratase [Anaerolineales bacterium]|uniref:CDP-glucose 4,6-dehydratase n=1 Tax=Promineifilum sp. TaxID=2664178 RepID=UPI001DBD0117|nr:CDP-glucose 4,6-dehydratase [Anaerolineales bacterium]MCB8935203.1 CDP-glucose 4,6-dehydratase [Promineifilum sp.]MCO5179012.1 CDP-glucose 4,6-dehydratase [Promineifilum sp.]
MTNPFNNIYAGKTVLITGHSGFKGSWLTTWLLELGANVVGYSLPDPPTQPSNFTVSGLAEHVTDVRGDIRDYDRVYETVVTYRPEIIFHLAAQPIVLRSVEQPKLTIDTNAGGTVNVLESIRQSAGHGDSVRALVSITTDKVYENQEWLWGYRETDQLGGHDPYSAGKAMAELAIAAYRSTYFPPERYGEGHHVAIASTRAGNVIGGGDFADYRLVPDCMKALMDGRPIGVRNPLSVRPWQHVLEPLSGYLWLGVQLLERGPDFGEAWNFGPLEQKGVPAQALAEKLVDLWGSGSWAHTRPGYAEVETGLLRLSWDKAAHRLNWRPVYSWADALGEITDWFKSFEGGADMHQVTRDHIQQYTARARALNLDWATG